MALAYEKDTNLAFDTTILRQCAKRYGAVAKDLRNMSKSLDNSLTELENAGWTTPAGTAFHEMTNVNWSENIEKYAALLDTLDHILIQSADKYEELLEDYVRTTTVKV